MTNKFDYEQFDNETKRILNKAMDIYSSIRDRKIEIENFTTITLEKLKQYEISDFDKKIMSLYISCYLEDSILKNILSEFDSIKPADLFAYLQINEQEIKPLANNEYKKFYEEYLQEDLAILIDNNIVTPETIFLSLNTSHNKGSRVLENFARKYLNLFAIYAHPSFTMVKEYAKAKGINFISRVNRTFSDFYNSKDKYLLEEQEKLEEQQKLDGQQNIESNIYFKLDPRTIDILTNVRKNNQSLTPSEFIDKVKEYCNANGIDFNDLLEVRKPMSLADTALAIMKSAEENGAFDFFHLGKQDKKEVNDYEKNRKSKLAQKFNCNENEISIGDIYSGTFNKLEGKKIHLGSIYSGDTSAENLIFPQYVIGNIELYKLTIGNGLVLPKSVEGNVKLDSLISAEGLKLPENIEGSLDLRGLTNAEGLNLPENIEGSLDLRGLTNAEGLNLPENIGGGLYLRSLTNAEGLKLPENIGGDLYLDGLTNTEGLILPKNIGGLLDLSGLTSAEGLILPENIGWYLDLSGLTSAEGLKLPENIGSDIHLEGLTSAKGLNLPDNFEGNLYLNGLTSAEGLKLPENIGGGLGLGGLIIAEGLTLPENIGGSLALSGLITAESLTLPKNIGEDLYLKGLTSAEGLELPQSVGRYLNLLGLTSAEGLKLPVGFDLNNLIVSEEVKAEIMANPELYYQTEELKEEGKTR